MTKISVGGGGGPQPRKPKIRHPQTKVAKGTNDLGRALGKALGAPQRATTPSPPPRLVDPVVRPNRAGVLHNPKGSGPLVRSQTSINRGRANSKHLPRAVRRAAQAQVSQHDREALLRGISNVAGVTSQLAHVKAPDKIDSIVSSVLGGHHGHDPIKEGLGLVGIKVPDMADVGKGILERSIYNPVRAFIEHPVDVGGATLRSVPNVATGTAGAIAELVTHPKQFAEQMPRQTIADLNRRYTGSLASQRDRMRHEGALSEGIDAMTALSPTGFAGGRIMNRTAASGALGDTAKAIATVRPKLRIHPGVHGAVEQELSPNFIRNVGRHVADNSRARAAVKRARRAEGGHLIADLVPGEGEVVKRFKRTQDAALRKGVNARQARGHARLTRATAEETRSGSQRDMYLKLGKHERQAVGEIMSLGLTPQTAERELRVRLEQLRAHRERKPIRLTGHDEVPVIESILAAPDKHLTPRAFQIADEQIARAKRTAAMDPQLKRNPDVALVRQYADQAAHLGLKRGVLKDGTLEPASDFVARVQKAAAERGLKEPGYLFAGDTGTRGAFASGRFGRAMAPNRQNRGIRFQAGTRDVGPEAVVLGPQRNIKRAVSWETTNDILEHNAPEWGKGKTVSQLNHEIVARKLDPSAWRFVDVGQVRDAVEASAQNHLPGGLQEAVNASTFTLDGIPAHFKSSGRRLTAIPKVVADELHVAAGPLHGLNRGWAKVQGAVSRTIIHTNPTFVPVQAVSNTPLALLAMKGDVRHFVRGSKLMKGVDAKARNFAEDYMGISASEGMAKAPRMGDTSTRLGGALAFFDSPQVRTWLDRKNPMHWNPILDEKQNNWFRRAVFHSYASKQRAVVISDAMRAIVGDAPKLTDLLKMPDGPVRDAAFRANEHLFEKVGNSAADLLGEYGRYSARERALLKTNVLFYGFLRWSVQFAFYTLPIKHPIAATIAGKLGQLHDEEVVDLLSSAAAAKGMGSKEAIADLLRRGAMPYVFGRVWITKKGKLESIDLTRVNPMLNPLMDALGSGPVGGAAKVISPALSPLLDLAYGKDQFTGRDLVNASGGKINYTSPLLEQLRVVGGDVGRLAFPLRVGDKLLHPQEQANDSVPLVAPSDKKATGPTDIARQAAKRQERGTNSEVLKDSLLPLVTSKQDGTLRGIAANMQKKGKVKKSSGGGDWNFSGAGGGGSTSSGADWNFR